MSSRASDRSPASILRVAAALVVAAAAAGPLCAQEEADAPPGWEARGDSVRQGVVEGRVLSSLDRRPVAGALVAVSMGEGHARIAVTDTAGRYRLPGLAPGRRSLRVTTLDHEPYRLAVRVPPGGRIRVDVLLEAAPLAVEPLLAVARRPSVPDLSEPPPASDDGGRPAETRLRALEAGPGTEVMGRALRNGRPEPPSDPSGALFVRGAGNDLKRVYLDGAPVFAPFHLGGLMDAVPEGVFRSARLYTGGAPLNVDGGLSYVLDLRTRTGEGDAVAGGGHTDLLGSSLRAEGEAGRFSYLVSGRRTHDATPAWMAEGGLPYGYSEALLRAGVRLSDGHQLSVTGFRNREEVALGDAAGTDASARWGNLAGSVRYGAVAGATRIRATAAAGRFTTRLPVSTEADRPGRARTRRSRLTVDATTPLSGAEISYGAAFRAHEQRIDLPPADSTPGVLWRGTGSTAAGYGQLALRPVPELTVRGGLRAEVYPDLGEASLSPRISATWTASEHTELELGLGRFRQRLLSPESALSGDLDEWSEVLGREARRQDDGDGSIRFPATSAAGATHTSLRLRHRATDGLELGFEGHFKTFDELAEGGRDLHSSGADLWVDLEMDRWTGWAGYSLGWVWSDALGSEGLTEFSGRQLIGAGLGAPGPHGLRLNAELRASTGLPFTRIPLTGAEADPTSPRPGSGDGTGVDDTPTSSPGSGPAFGGSPDGSYLRLDVTLSRSWTTEWLGRETRLRPYLRFLNALDRRDALFFHFDPAREMRPRGLDTVPLLPVVGLEWTLP